MKKYYSLWFCLVSILIFILQVIISGFTDFFVLNNKVFEGEFWRYLTAIFLHGNLPHLLYNLFALAFFGFSLERLIGNKKFLLVFFLSGIIANLISVNFYESSLGLSGAIMGIIGALAVIRPMMIVWAFGLVMPMFIAAILWIIGDIIGIFIPDNIGNIAHLSGVFIGIFIGLLLRKKKPRSTKFKIPENYARVWEDRYMK